jgi:pimeloyl-ACP methyl ester carboxylesterase
MPQVRVNGVRLYYEELGHGDPILCIHGTSSSARVWRTAATRELSELGRVIVYDRRGCTRSERPEPYETSVVQHAEDAAALLRALDAAPAVVIGRSYGGETAIELALRDPELVRALVLLEAAALTLDAEAMAWGDALRRKVEDAAARDPGSVAETFLREVLGDEAWEAFPPHAKQMFVDNGPSILAEFRGPWLEATESDLGRISVPTLLIGGTDSPEPFRRVTETMAAAIPGSRTEFVGGRPLHRSRRAVGARVRPHRARRIASAGRRQRRASHPALIAAA